VTPVLRQHLRRAVLLLVILGVLAALPAVTVAAQEAAAGRVRVIVQLHDTVERPEAVAADLGRRGNGRTQFVYQHALKGFAIEVPARVVPVLAQDPRVTLVEEDQAVTAFGLPTGADRIEADKRPSTGINGVDDVRVDVDIAILDTGIANHPELNVVGGTNCTLGFSFCFNGAYADVHGHGTHVAGTAAAIDGGQVVGVAPGARLWAVKVLGDNGGGSIAGIIAGIDWVTARATTIEVINMSLGCECSSAALDSAIVRATQAGLVVVAAAGNEGKNAAGFSPGRHPNVISVSAMADFDGKAGGAAASTCRSDAGADDTFATFSNFGSTVTLAAPGVCIYSTVPGNHYAHYSGTSMASPHVAGAAALYIVERAVPRTASRWSSVRSGLLSSDWSTPQTGSCGFSGGKSAERMLMLAPCDQAGAPPPPPATGTLTGTVSASSGGPIAGATVAVDGLGLSTTTNAGGQYTLANVPTGSRTVTASAASFATGSQTVTVNGGTTVTANFTLTPLPTTGTLTGTVTSAAGGIVSGATVAIQGTALSTTTNGAGQYTLTDIPQGQRTLATSATGYASTSQTVTITAGATTTANVVLTPDAPPSGGPLVLTLATSSASDYRVNQPVVISVTVRSNGTPVAGAAVTVVVTPPVGSATTISGTTNASGIATLTYLPWVVTGTYGVTAMATHPAFATGSVATTFTIRR
jgi:subtilisin family serine protease